MSRYPAHAAHGTDFARPLLAVLLGGALLFGVACGDSDGGAPELSDPSATGGELVNEYLTLLQEKDADGLRDFLSDAFIIQRADGSYSFKAAYVENIPDIGEFTITDVTALQTEDLLIVRWFLTVDEVINGRPFAQEPAPRLSTFVYHDDDWRLASHANFNVPDALTPPAGPRN